MYQFPIFGIVIEATARLLKGTLLVLYRNIQVAFEQQPSQGQIGSPQFRRLPILAYYRS